MHNLFIMSPLWARWIVFIAIVSACRKDDILFSSIQLDTFSFQEVEVSTVFQEGNRLKISVPYGTNLKSLTPTFILDGGGEIIPNLGGYFDFTSAKYFTVISPTSGKRVYEIKVIIDDQPNPIIKKVDLETIQAGQRLNIEGDYFGQFRGDIKIVLYNESALYSVIPFRLIDSRHIEIAIPDTISPATYQLSLSVRDKQTISSANINVLYPSPQITALQDLCYLQADTLFFSGRFLNTSKYKLVINFLGSGQFNSIVKNTDQESFAIVPSGLPPGGYKVELENQTEFTKSEPYAQEIVVYDKNRPFIREVLNVKNVYSEGEEIRFKTLNFKKGEFRFNQIILENGSDKRIENGIYDENKEELIFEIPRGIKAGEYTSSISLFGDDPNKKYNFKTNIFFKIR